MDQQELVQGILNEAFSWQNLVGLSVTILGMAALGWYSARRLRALPDFPHRAEMLWGARWFWAVWLAVLAVTGAQLYYGVTRTPYVTTNMLLPGLLLGVLMGLASRHLPHQGTGMFYGMSQLPPNPQSFEDFVRGLQEPPTRRRRLIASAGKVVGLLVLAGWLFFIFAVAYPIDCMTIDYAYADSIGAAVHERLGPGLVEEIQAYSPVDESSWIPGLDGAWKSLRTITGFPPTPPLPETVWGCYHIYVKLDPGTDASVRQRLLRETYEALREAGAKQYWWVIVRGRERGKVTYGVYPREPRPGFLQTMELRSSRRGGSQE